MQSSRFVASFTLLSALAFAAPRAQDVGDYRALHWRLVGPLRGGWATVACGVPGAPNTFYFGAADGGVWKTTDAGRTWNGLFQHESVSSIGALEVAPSDPSVIWIGTGQVTTRWDVTSGDGVYRSNDGGASWKHCGLAESEHIGRIWVDPRDANVALVAALGHLFAPNDERGVYRTSDGGATWSRVLFVDASTGAVDLAADDSTPDVVFASTWQARQYPWQSYFTPIVGPGSAVHRSTDGGRTWKRLDGVGLPSGAVGRIGLAVAPSSGARRVFATVNAGAASGLYRSDDGGDHWARINSDGDLANPYFSMVAVDPKNSEHLFAMGRSIRASTDGGKTFEFTRGAPGGDDYHFLWIDPGDGTRRITASDQGAVITVNDGASWSSWYNQPTGQFYRLALDDRFPYWIYSGQQDSGTAALASRSDFGQLTFRDWHPVGGDERDFDIPFPGDPNWVFCTGLGGRLTRFDSRTGQVAVVSPWPVSSYGQRPSTVRYRTTWITPLAISKLAPHAIYQGAQVLFRSLDRGDSWQVISPDLTGAASGASECEGDVAVEHATACGYGVIFSIAPSPLERETIWIGTDNGRVQLTRDGGHTWQNVTPPGLADWSKVAAIDASPLEPASAVIAVDRHRVDDSSPYVYVTHDFGKSWRSAAAGLPAHAYVNVVRQDPERAGLLFAGASHGAFVSFDDGASWRSLQLDLPTTGVNDLAIHGNDLVAATEGRGIWALDDFSLLRHEDGAALGAAAVLFPPATAQRVAPNQNRDTPLPTDEPRAENPKVGAVIDYRFAHAPTGPIELAIFDAQGQAVRRFSSDAPETRPNASRYFDDEWLQPIESLPAQAGHNRFVWNLRLPRPRALAYEFSIAAVPGADTPALPQGLFVRPGRYEVRLRAEGRTLTAPLVVAADPRVDVSTAVFDAQFSFYRDVVAFLERATDACVELTRLSEALRELASDAPSNSLSPVLRSEAKTIADELERFRSGTSDDNLAELDGRLGTLATDLEGADAAPTAPQRELYAEEARRIDSALGHWTKFREVVLVAFDRRLRDAGAKPLGL